MISLFGFGKTTKSLMEYLNGKGYACNVYDDSFLEKSIDESGNVFSNPKGYARSIEMAITSPAIPPHHHLIKNSEILLSEYDFVYGLLSSPPKSVWISGTNGKTTTTEMMGLLLKKYGGEYAGNIGIPLIELYEKNPPIWILETSSFTLHYTKVATPNIYVLLALSEDHISWHGSFEDYVADKLSVLERMDKDSFAFIPKSLANRDEIQKFKGKAYFYENSTDLAEEFCLPLDSVRFEEPFLLDATLAICASSLFSGVVDVETLNDYKIGAHKIEEFSDADGRLWVDDSKGTNIDATLEAIKRYKNKKILLILGGDDKGADFRVLFEFIKDLDLEVFAIGSSSERVMELCKEYGILARECLELEVAVAMMKGVLRVGDVGLLSPSASSLDQFSSYKQRGDEFKKFVLS